MQMTLKKHLLFSLALILAVSCNENNKPDWKQVLVEVLLKIITLGIYHVEKHKKQ